MTTHTDDLAVDRFAHAMKTKLAAKRAEGRSGWDDSERCTVEYLAELLVVHVSKGDPVDVANFAMMLHQRGAAPSVLSETMVRALDRERFIGRKQAENDAKQRPVAVTVEGVSYVPVKP